MRRVRQGVQNRALGLARFREEGAPADGEIGGRVLAVDGAAAGWVAEGLFYHG